MQEVMQQRPDMNTQAAHSRLRRKRSFETRALGFALTIVAPFIVPAIVGGRKLAGQTAALPAKAPAQQQSGGYHVAQPQRSTAEADQAASMQLRATPEPIGVQFPAVPAPIRSAKELAEQPAKRATVSWDSRGLKIEASNSSLRQILHQVAAETGAKLEGITQDQRIFGSYGPGPGCEVLSQLLEGSGYNVLMTGSPDGDAPVSIILSARSPGSAQTETSNRNRSSSADNEPAELPTPGPQPDYPGQPAGPHPVQNPFANGGPAPHDPLQFMQDILQRQQVIDQQQEQKQKDQQNNPQQ